MGRRQLGALLVIALAVAVTPASAAPPLELPALTRVASKLSGLKAKRKITVASLSKVTFEARALTILDRDYPRAQQAYDETVYRSFGLLPANQRLRPALVSTYVRGIRSFYDPVSRTVYARSGTSVRQAVLYELIHALQDQSFNLRRLSTLRRTKHDAGLAANAAVQGSATLFTDSIVGAHPTRDAQSHGGSRIALFLGLEAEFAYGTGLRFAATLKNLGGTSAVNGSVRSFPTTSEQIFHVDAFLSREGATAVTLPQTAGAMGLVRSDSFGELDVRALLAVYQVPRLDHAGEGWGGGRTALYRDPAGGDAVAVALDWETDLDALEWREAVFELVNEAWDADVPGQPAPVTCEADACWSLANGIAFAASGSRTVLVFGPSATRAASLARAIVH